MSELRSGGVVPEPDGTWTVTFSYFGMWEVSQRAARCLARRMGIAKRIRVERSFSGANASYVWARRWPFRRAHVVNINPMLSVEQAARALCHELGHALQCEARGLDYGRLAAEHRAQLAVAGVSTDSQGLPIELGSSYASVPLEREAQDAAERWAPEAVETGAIVDLGAER